MTTKQKILVKRAEMLALHNRYVKAMQAGQKEIEKIASEYQVKQAAYRKVVEGLARLKKEAGTSAVKTAARARGSSADYFNAAARAKEVYKDNPALATQILRNANAALLGYGYGAPVYDVPNAASRYNSATAAKASRDGTLGEKVEPWIRQ